MSIQEVYGKFKDWRGSTDMVLVLIIVVTATMSFVLGRLSLGAASVGEPVSSTARVESETPPAHASATVQQYVASKSGTKYHLSWCGSAKQIKEENKIWFATKEEAEAAGYAPATNCKGI